MKVVLLLRFQLLFNREYFTVRTLNDYSFTSQRRKSTARNNDDAYLLLSAAAQLFMIDVSSHLGALTSSLTFVVFSFHQNFRKMIHHRRYLNFVLYWRACSDIWKTKRCGCPDVIWNVHAINDETFDLDLKLIISLSLAAAVWVFHDLRFCFRGRR